jgi:hypothetical protein
MPEFRPQVAEREARKRDELAPWIARALARKRAMRPLADAEIPVVPASRARAEVNQSTLDR